MSDWDPINDLLDDESYWDSLLEDEDETMVDLGGGMVVPLRELLEDDE